MTSRHSSEGGRRGVAPWIIITAVAVLVIAVSTTAYLLIIGGSDDAKAATCSSQVVLGVVSAPGATAAITDAATAFDATNPVARSACVSTTVATMQSLRDRHRTGRRLAAGPCAGPGHVGGGFSGIADRAGGDELRADRRPGHQPDGDVTGCPRGPHR